MSEQNKIPDAAVEVVAVHMEAVIEYIGAGVQMRNEVRAALEAAAPHMLAKGWDEGWQKAQGYELAANPYRERGEN